MANHIAAALGRPVEQAAPPGDPDEWRPGAVVTGASGQRYRVVSPEAMFALVGK